MQCPQALSPAKAHFRVLYAPLQEGSKVGATYVGWWELHVRRQWEVALIAPLLQAPRSAQSASEPSMTEQNSLRKEQMHRHL